MKDIVDELRDLMSYRPVTADKVACKQLVKYVQSEVNKIGMKTRISTHNGFSSLVAGTKSLTSSKILLQAHVDVVPADDSAFVLQKKGDKLSGRGTYDMLFGAASFLTVLRKFHEVGDLSKLDIGLMLTADEEIGGFDGVARLIKDYDCSACILPDAGGLDLISVGAKGVLELVVSARGRSGHAARPLEYDNPIYRLADITKKLQSLFKNDNMDMTTCSQTMLQAGEAINQVPEEAKLFLDIRYVSEDNPDDIEKSVSKLLKKYGATVKRLVCEPAFTTDINDAELQRYTRTHKQITSRGMQTMRAPGSSDARFMTQKNIPVIMTRPSGGGMHGSNEWISIASLNEFTDVLQAYLKQAA